ncbi:MAG: dTDP-glucose 4,6-dehydratase [Elusimicrobiota bacterium]
MDTLIVTGGAGFIGSNLVRTILNSSQDRVIVVDKLTYAGNLASLKEVMHHPRFVFVEADIQDSHMMANIFKEYEPQGVFNLAAETHVDRSIEGPHVFINTNVMGTMVLLESTKKYFAGLSDENKEKFRYLQISTDEVYGSLGKTGAFKETTAYDPRSPYSASKAAGDHLAKAYYHTYGLPVIVTNCSNNYGPFQFPEKLIPLVILNALEGKPLPIYGDGSNVRDWLYVEDHCAGLYLAWKKGRVGETYNIGGENEKTNLQTIDTICSLLDEFLPIQQNQNLKDKNISSYKELKTFVPDRPGHDKRYAIDATKFRKETGWEPKHSYKENMKKTVEWYLEHKQWCELVQSGKYRRERLGLVKS